MVFKVDEIDIKIISALLENGRLPARKLAEQIGVHPNTLLQRLKRLEGQGVIKKYAAYVDFAQLGYDLHVIVLMEVRRGHAGDAEQLNDLLKIKEIEALYATTGMWDLVAIVRVKNRMNLLEVIQKIGNNKIVTKTITQIVVFPYKSPYEFNPL